jgi:hypothetical protein
LVIEPPDEVTVTVSPVLPAFEYVHTLPDDVSALLFGLVFVKSIEAA